LRHLGYSLNAVLDHRKVVLALLVLLALCSITSTLTYAGLSVNQTLASTGTITVSPNLAVYADSQCTQPIVSINWGNLAIGQTVTRIIYVKNTGTGASLNLDMRPVNWSPAGANNYLTLAWNPDTSRIMPNESTAVDLTLSVSPSIFDVTVFSVQISITGTAP
jgi:hypothetical protein